MCLTRLECDEKKYKSDTEHIFQMYIAKNIESGEMLHNTDKSGSLSNPVYVIILFEMKVWFFIYLFN